MLAVFVHGMGRTSLSGWPLLSRLRDAGLRTATFGYSAAFDDFQTIERRLVDRLAQLSRGEPYVLIGHSLGGVLIRAALGALPEGVERPRHVFLLGSPILAARLAVRLRGQPIFRVLTGDCGQLLASPERMAQVPPLREPATSIVGVAGMAITRAAFGAEPNDGVVSVSEASADWLTHQERVPVVHTLLPASGRVAAMLIEHLLSGARNEEQSR